MNLKLIVNEINISYNYSIIFCKMDNVNYIHNYNLYTHYGVILNHKSLLIKYYNGEIKLKRQILWTFNWTSVPPTTSRATNIVNVAVIFA